MKKISVISILFAFLILSSSSVSAQGATNSSVQRNRNEIRERIEEQRLELIKKREELRKRIEEKRATVAARLTQIRIERIRNHWARLKRRLLAVVERFSKLINRIQSYLATIENSDVSEIEQQLEVTQESLDQIELDIQAVDENIEIFLESENPKEAYKEIRDKIKEIKANLIEIHRTLIQVLVDIKQLNN